MKKILIVDDSRSWVAYHKENMLCNIITNGLNTNLKSI